MGLVIPVLVPLVVRVVALMLLVVVVVLHVVLVVVLVVFPMACKPLVHACNSSRRQCGLLATNDG